MAIDINKISAEDIMTKGTKGFEIGTRGTAEDFHAALLKGQDALKAKEDDNDRLFIDISQSHGLKMMFNSKKKDAETRAATAKAAADNSYIARQRYPMQLWHNFQEGSIAAF